MSDSASLFAPDQGTRWGRGTLVPAAAGLKRPWSTRFERRSPRHTTRLDELPTASAGA